LILVRVNEEIFGGEVLNINDLFAGVYLEIIMRENRKWM